MTQTTYTPLDAARTNLARAEQASKNAQTALREAREAYGQAQVDHGRANPHPLAGKRVTSLEGRWGVAKYVTGTVVLHDNVYRSNHIKHSAEPGEWFVVSDSGKTGYSLTSAVYDWQVVS